MLASVLFPGRKSEQHNNKNHIVTVMECSEYTFFVHFDNINMRKILKSPNITHSAIRKHNIIIHTHVVSWLVIGSEFVQRCICQLMS